MYSSNNIVTCSVFLVWTLFKYIYGGMTTDGKFSGVR